MDNTEPLSEIISQREQDKIEQEREGRTIAKLDEPETRLTFDEWMAVIRDAFIDLAFAIEVEMSILATLLIHDIGACIALLLVDSASSGKTISLSIFRDIQKIVYPTDQITAASFVSNSAKTKKEDLKHIDLLPKIRNKAVLCPDMAPILAAREDDMTRTMGVLTRVLDGEGYQTDTGMHGQRKYDGDYRFVLIGATTPIEKRVWKAMSRLGPRLLCLCLRSREKSEDQLVLQLRGASFHRKRRRCQVVTDQFAKTLWNTYPNGVVWEGSKDHEDCLPIIARCARVTAKLRALVSDYEDECEVRDSRHRRTIHVEVVAREQPDRLNQTFFDVARGHAIIKGRTSLSLEDMIVILRLTFDTVPEKRWYLMRMLILAGGELTTSGIQSYLSCSNPTALKVIATLCVIGICEEDEAREPTEDKCIRLRPEYQWFTSDQCRELLVQAELLPRKPKRRSKQG